MGSVFKEMLSKSPKESKLKFPAKEIFVSLLRNRETETLPRVNSMGGTRVGGNWMRRILVEWMLSGGKSRETLKEMIPRAFLGLTEYWVRVRGESGLEGE